MTIIREPTQLPTARPFTRTEARDHGMTDRRLAQAVKAGELRRPLRGVFVSARLPDTIDLRVACLALVMPEGCFVADHTAGWLFCGDAILPPNAHLEVPKPAIFRPSDAGRLRNPLCRSGERAVLPEDLCTVGGIVSTTMIRTAWDLGRLQQRDVALAGMDQLMRAGGFALDELCAGVKRFDGERGVVQLRVLAPRVDGGAESFGESALRNRWYDAGLVRPQTQIPIMVGDREVYRLDVGDPDRRYAAEYRGVDFHTEEDAAADDDRQEWVESQRGYIIDNFVRENVFGPRTNADVVLRRRWDEAGASLARRSRLPLS